LKGKENQPVDAGEDFGLSKGRGVVVVPECAVVGIWRREGVVEGGDEEKQVADGGGDLGQEERAVGGGGVGVCHRVVDSSR
jgi:hypothetical protein